MDPDAYVDDQGNVYTAKGADPLAAAYLHSAAVSGEPIEQKPSNPEQSLVIIGQEMVDSTGRTLIAFDPSA